MLRFRFAFFQNREDYILSLLVPFSGSDVLGAGQRNPLELRQSTANSFLQLIRCEKIPSTQR